jgi:uncharacterized protein YndB with AHSA1/START domain
MDDETPRHPIGFGPGTVPGSGSGSGSEGAAERHSQRRPAGPGPAGGPGDRAPGARADRPVDGGERTDGDGEPDRRDRDVHRRIVLETAPAETWRLLTDPHALAAWWGDGTTIDLSPGGAARFREDGEPDRQGRVVEVKPGRRLVFDWWPEDPEVDEPASRVTIELVPCPFGTVLTVTECMLLPLDELPVLVAPRPTFLPSPWGPGPSARAARARVLVRA